LPGKYETLPPDSAGVSSGAPLPHTPTKGNDLLGALVYYSHGTCCAGAFIVPRVYPQEKPSLVEVVRVLCQAKADVDSNG